MEKKVVSLCIALLLVALCAACKAKELPDSKGILFWSRLLKAFLSICKMDKDNVSPAWEVMSGWARRRSLPDSDKKQ